MQDMHGAIDKITVAGVVVACALPSAAANILPRVQALFGPTPATPGEIAAIVTLVMTALLMAACPFAIKRAGNAGEKLVCLVVGLGLATFNYIQAHDTIGKLRDLSTEPVRQLQKTAAELNSASPGPPTPARNSRSSPGPPSRWSRRLRMQLQLPRPTDSKSVAR